MQYSEDQAGHVRQKPGTEDENPSECENVNVSSQEGQCQCRLAASPEVWKSGGDDADETPGDQSGEG